MNDNDFVLEFKANDRKSILTLAECLMASRTKPQIAYHLHALGLMKNRQFGWMIKFLRWVRGENGVANFYITLNRIDSSIINAWIADAAAHCLHGDDTEDSDSVGGWSQRELDLLATKVKFTVTQKAE